MTTCLGALLSWLALDRLPSTVVPYFGAGATSVGLPDAQVRWSDAEPRGFGSVSFDVNVPPESGRSLSGAHGDCVDYELVADVHCRIATRSEGVVC